MDFIASYKINFTFGKFFCCVSHIHTKYQIANLKCYKINLNVQLYHNNFKFRFLLVQLCTHFIWTKFLYLAITRNNPLLIQFNEDVMIEVTQQKFFREQYNQLISHLFKFKFLISFKNALIKSKLLSFLATNWDSF